MLPQYIPSRVRPRSHLRRSHLRRSHLRRSHLRRALPLIATLLTLTATAPIALPTPARAIVGGSLASPGDYPFMVSLRENGFPYCGGTLVAPRWVLTAAHCATGHSTAELTAVVDQVKVAGTGGEARGIDRISVDPSYDPTTEDYDAALFHLAATTTGIAPQPLIRAGDRAADAPGTVATVVGYGSTSPQAIDGGGPITYPASLQQAQVAIVSNTRCAAVFNGRDEPSVRTDLMMCAGGDGHDDACVGDSGGPLLVPGRAPGTWTDVAITSWGAGCAVAGVPGVYTRLADPQIADFVESTLTGP